MSPPTAVAESSLQAAVDDIVDELVMEVIFASHMEAKMGVLFLEEELVEESGNGRSGSGCDSEPALLNQLLASGSLAKKPVMCRCPNCNRNMAALRFATHLEKCMGMGRTSSRLASRKIATLHRFSDESDSDDQPPPMKQRRQMKRSATAPGVVANVAASQQPLPLFNEPEEDPTHAASLGVGDDDWEGLSTPSPSSASTGSSGHSSAGARGQQQLHHSSSKR